jgi:hypothetical protein
MHILENKAYLMFAERDPPEEKTFWNNHLSSPFNRDTGMAVLKPHCHQNR